MINDLGGFLLNVIFSDDFQRRTYRNGCLKMVNYADVEWHLCRPSDCRAMVAETTGCRTSRRSNELPREWVCVQDGARPRFVATTRRIITHVPDGSTLVYHAEDNVPLAAPGPTWELVLSTRRREARRPLVKMVPGRGGHVRSARRVHFSCRTQYGRVAIVRRRRYRRHVTVKANCRSAHAPRRAERRDFRWHAGAETRRIIARREWTTSC